MAPAYMLKQPRFALKDTGAIAILGIFQFAVLIILLNYALANLPATTCALVFSTMPLFTMCLAIMLRREAYSPTKLAGIALAIAGVAYLLSEPAAQAVSIAPAHSLPGYAALAGATLTGAATSIMYGPYLRRYPSLPTCVRAMGAAVLFLVGFCWVTAQPLLPSLTLAQWANVGFIGLSSGAGYFCWLWALAKMEASRVVAFQALGPVTAAIIESALARHLPSWALISSLAMVAAGLLLAMRRKRPCQAAQPSRGCTGVSRLS
jgi:drug/metabolite transporter (DMT)-like permease